MTIEYDYDEFLYHQHHAFSSTQARQILESPAWYKWNQTHPRSGNQAFDIGHAAHAKILGVGAGVVAYPSEHLTPSGNVSTKAAATAWAEAQRNEGLTPVSPDWIAAVDAMAEAVLAHAEARRLFEQPGSPEASVFAHCGETGIDVRARFDYLPDLSINEPIAVDLKTARGKATPRDFGRAVAEHRYDVQQGHYLDALHLETGRDDIAMRFVVVEKNAPHFVGVHQLDDLYSHIGIDAARDARRTLRECLDTDTWPTGLEDIQYLDAPNWLIEDVEVSI